MHIDSEGSQVIEVVLNPRDARMRKRVVSAGAIGTVAPGGRHPGFRIARIRVTNTVRITSYNVCYTKLLRRKSDLSAENIKRDPTLAR